MRENWEYIAKSVKLIFTLNTSSFFYTQSNTNNSVRLDYVLIIPESKFKEHLITEEPMNSVDRFRKECGLNHFYMDNSTSGKLKNYFFDKFIFLKLIGIYTLSVSLISFFLQISVKTSHFH